MKVSKEWKGNSKKKPVSTRDIREAVIPHQSFDREGNHPIVFDSDYFGNKRKQHAYPGPIEFTEEEGVCLIKVFP